MKLAIIAGILFAAIVVMVSAAGLAMFAAAIAVEVWRERAKERRVQKHAEALVAELEQQLTRETRT